ncbi:bifunctional 2-C-methyl-D-erythritol 4-phosphate cytidylyltransferase/2-C-methyl-D-erythritol 2,4-cyclodiphosphate synthase [Aliishimia ponticola]|uniref:Bifunctional enzyme IspD/IspF n=1 Tax=Aliishimia ponticola TaxID=2499833 RepID=A0A4S4NR98_9RHOB|nr:bifunctional 2-C-methyl-D-erythritol 4-phosphate cytidylyltransferase/2-C-methyl-D-erythritol 2,4-cyclodiphosphate synthase [Aliishimia ponticola]THH38740.1 bifunctional 2-C-methyl-D-erythritol 4-phosphate cytidylyltransferase/2-C-methyl-D-erythritol 2,4-cyclodiphosphate synthase [Aliishimia ponticola]
MKRQGVDAIIVAAGRGLRAGGGTPKQWRELHGAPVVEHTLRAFRTHPDIKKIVLVIHPEDSERCKTLQTQPDLFANGGASRAASVRAGLDALSDNPAQGVLIHDVARPCVSHKLISNVIEPLYDSAAAAPALPVTDALWTGMDGHVTGTHPRDGLFRAQTPQGFRYRAIREAHSHYNGPAADDVEVARAAGIEVSVVPGDEDNLKITHASDFARAERILGGRMKIRLGNGFDVHAFGPGDHVTLCGVKIPHDHGLVGHSDADVAMHTVTDAIYGALAMGDIGQHFPPSDPQWKGADSAVFLRHAVDLAAQEGLTIGNIDCTIICEAPKIGPHAQAMRESMAQIMGVDVGVVSVKATTSEKLGFTGRGEGIACMATCMLEGK